MPLISFIIPYYNLPREFLAECVASVLRLPFGQGECEVIVVDDGSDEDLSAFIGTEFPGCVNYVRQENKGLSGARNTGIELAQGQYIQFVDGDDKLFSENYVQLLPLLRQGQTDVLLFRFSHKEDGEGRSPLSARTYDSGTDYMRRCNLRAAACAYVFRRELLGTLRFEPQLLHEDELFTPQLLLKAGTTLESGLCAYYYRVREQSITQQADVVHCQRRAESLFSVLERLQELLTTLHGKDREALSRRIAQLGMDALYTLPQLVDTLEAYEAYITRLRSKRLFPLPLRPYTVKYFLFALLTRCKLVRRQLYAVRRRER